MFMYLGKQANKWISMSHIYMPSHLLHFLTNTAHLLVKVGEEIDSECMLFVEFVSICILYCLEGLGGSSIFQEDVPVWDKDLSLTLNSTLKQCTNNKVESKTHTLWSCHQPRDRTQCWSCQTWRKSCVWHSWVSPNAPGPPAGRCPPPPPSLCRQPPGVSPSGCHPGALKRRERGVGRETVMLVSYAMRPPASNLKMIGMICLCWTEAEKRTGMKQGEKREVHATKVLSWKLISIVATCHQEESLVPLSR